MIKQDSHIELMQRAGVAGEISFEEAWQALKSFDFNDGDLEKFISRLGTNTPAYFKHFFKGGLEIQQVPAEIAGLIRYLWRHHPALRTYLEVGTGKGGTFMLLNESWRARGIKPELSVADNFCYAPLEQQERFDWVRRQYDLQAFIGDTRTPAFQEFLGVRRFEVIFIDGDHSFQGCLADFIAAYPNLEENGSMIFHDIVSTACPGVGEVFEIAKKYFAVNETFIDSTTCGIGVLRGKKRPAISGLTGLGLRFRHALRGAPRRLKGMLKKTQRCAALSLAPEHTEDRRPQ
jgi:hypothetical protein